MSEIRAVFWVGFLAFLWLKVVKKHGMSEIHAVGELSCWGCKLENRVSNCVPFCYWKGAKFAEKEFCGQFCVNFWRASSTQCLNLKNILHAGGQGRKCTKFWFFYKVRDEGFPPFPKEKIDSRVFVA